MSDYFADFQAGLVRRRRNACRFRTAPVDEATLRDCLATFALVLSLGLSEPLRVVRMETR